MDCTSAWYNNEMQPSEQCPLLPTLDEMRKGEELELERLRWAVKTAQNSPHLWQHKYKGTPLQILIEHAQKSV